MRRPDGTFENIESNDNVVVHGIDANGEYLGLVSPEQAVGVVSKAPPYAGLRWLEGKWQRSLTLAEVKVLAQTTIDATAGAARLRYITDVPGQGATYLLKAEQAAAFIAAGGVGTVPPYIQAEADATGATPMQAATNIDAIAQAWAGVLGPAIERERIRGKRLVDAALTAEAVAAEMNTAKTVLDSI